MLRRQPECLFSIGELSKAKPLTISIGLFFFGLLLLNHFFGFTGPFGFDDIEYARLGYLFSSGNPDFTNPFTFRFGAVLPVGYLQKVLGITDTAAAIYPLLLLSLLIFLIYKSTYHNKSFFLALCILFSCPWIVFYSDKIGVDIPVTVYLVLALYVFYLGRFKSPFKKQALLYGALLSLTLFIALLTKETVWFFVPLLAVFFIRDLIKKQHLTFWMSATLLIIVLMLAYSAWQKISFGDWFYRFNLIKANDNTNTCSYDRQPFAVVFKRISTDLWFYLIAESCFIIPIVLLIATLSKQYFLRPFSKESFWQSASVLLVLSANFWTISYNSYHPLCVEIRHYLYIFPVCAIAIANNYQLLFRRWAIGLVLVTSLTILVFKNQLQLKQVAVIDAYLILGVFVFLLILKKCKRHVIMALVAVPLYNLFAQIKNASEYKYPLQEKVARDFLEGKQNTTIYTSETQERLFKYYLGFQIPKDLALVSYAHFNQLRKGYHYWNYHTIALSKQFNAIPAAINAVSNPKNLVKQEGDIIKIYQTYAIDEKLQTYQLKSDFFSKQLNGDGFVEILPDQEFGLTFSKAIPPNVKHINVSSSWTLLNQTLNDAYLVFSLEEEGKLLHYQAYSIKNDWAAIDHTYQLFKGISIDNPIINKYTVLKIYIWNKDAAQLTVKSAEVVLALD